MSVVGRYTGNCRSAIIVVVEARASTHPPKDQLTISGFHQFKFGSLLGPRLEGGGPHENQIGNVVVALDRHGRAGSETLLRKSNGQPWKRSDQGRPMADACTRAKIEPVISFHILRHTWASLAVMAGTPAMVVSRNLGHTTTKMVERFYSHLAPSYVTDAIRKGAPRFGIDEPDPVVVALPR